MPAGSRHVRACTFDGAPQTPEGARPEVVQLCSATMSMMFAIEHEILLLDTDDEMSSEMTSPASVTVTAVTTVLTFATYNSTNDVKTKMWLIVSPILLVVGLAGNSLVLVTMTRQVMSGTSSCIYLVAMAALDIGVLLVGLVPEWLGGASITPWVTEINPALCRSLRFLKYVFVDASIWVRILFTIDRCVAVQHPLYSGQCCGRVNAARTYVIVAMVTSCVFNSPALFTRGAEYRYDTRSVSTLATNDSSTPFFVNVTSVVLVNNCGTPTAGDKYFDSIFRPWLVLVFASLLPFVLITIANAIIIFSLVQRRRMFVNASLKTAVTSVIRVTTGKKLQEDYLHQVTSMCFATSGLFLLCTAPGIILLIGKDKWSLPKGDNAPYEITTNANNLLFYVIFAGNFFLYCMTGERFRSTLRSVCSRLRWPTVFAIQRHDSVVHSRPSPADLSMTLSTVIELSRTPINAIQHEGIVVDSSV